jgi:hypothetical protein
MAAAEKTSIKGRQTCVLDAGVLAATRGLFRSPKLCGPVRPSWPSIDFPEPCSSNFSPGGGGFSSCVLITRAVGFHPAQIEMPPSIRFRDGEIAFAVRRLFSLFTWQRIGLFIPVGQLGVSDHTS